MIFCVLFFFININKLVKNHASICRSKSLDKNCQRSLLNIEFYQQHRLTIHVIQFFKHCRLIMNCYCMFTDFSAGIILGVSASVSFGIVIVCFLKRRKKRPKNFRISIKGISIFNTIWVSKGFGSLYHFSKKQNN